MSNLIEKSIHTMKQGVDSLKNIKKEKQEYKEYLERIKDLPDEFRFTYEKMTEYMWSFCGGGDGYDMISLQTDLLELFELSAAEGKHVFEITGEDVAIFCDELLRNAKTYTGNRREKLNKDIQKKLGNKTNV